MKYVPHPIDTADAKLTDELLGLTELLAKNAHDVWARQRLAEGWTHGPNRDDVAKTHPDLVPFEELADSEKQYDRMAVMDTLRAITALGFQIARRPG